MAFLSLGCPTGCKAPHAVARSIALSAGTGGASSRDVTSATRFGTLRCVPEAFYLRSDNGLVFTSRDYTRLVRSDGLTQEFIMSHCPQQNGLWKGSSGR